MFDRFRRLEDPETQSQQGLASETNELTSLSWETRLYCFAGCLILSLVCSFLGSPMLFAGKMSGFAVMVSLGSVISILGTFFLAGPTKQLKSMFEMTRLIATLVYLLMIVLTLVAGLVLQNPPLALICVVGQYLAMAWYSISYIPYARQMVGSCFGKCF